MKVISDKITVAVATSLHSFDLLPTTTFEDMQEKLSEDAVIKRYRTDNVFHAKVCSITASVLLSVGDEIATLTRQRDLAVEALEKWDMFFGGDAETAVLTIAEDPSTLTGCQKATKEALSTIKESEGKLCAH